MWNDNSLNRGESSQDEASIWRRVALWVRVRHWCFAREKQRVERLIADHLKQCGCGRSSMDMFPSKNHCFNFGKNKEKPSEVQHT